MLTHIAERISALGPRFGLPLQTIQAVEAQAGRKRAVAFALEHDDLTVKAMGVVLADVVLGTRLLSAPMMPTVLKTKKPLSPR